MPIISRAFSIILRVGEIAFSAVVAGIIGHYLNISRSTGTPANGRWIYTEVVAAISLLLGLIWLIPFTSTLIAWHADLLLSVAWFAAFGILVNDLDVLSCGGIWDWTNLVDNSDCSRWKAAEAFSFLSAIFWLASAFLGLFVIWRLGARNTDRKYWYGRYDV